MTYDLDLWPNDMNINRDHLLIMDYLPSKFKASCAKRSWVVSLTRSARSMWFLTFDLDLWPTDLKIDRDYRLTKDYIPTKYEAYGAKPSWVISYARLRETDIPTDQQVQSNMPCLFQRGINIHVPSDSFDIRSPVRFTFLLNIWLHLNSYGKSVKVRETW